MNSPDTPYLTFMRELWGGCLLWVIWQKVIMRYWKWTVQYTMSSHTALHSQWPNIVQTFNSQKTSPYVTDKLWGVYWGLGRKMTALYWRHTTCCNSYIICYEPDHVCTGTFWTCTKISALDVILGHGSIWYIKLQMKWYIFQIGKKKLTDLCATGLVPISFKIFHIPLKGCFVLNVTLIKWSRQNSAHGMTALLSCHVQKFVASAQQKLNITGEWFFHQIWIVGENLFVEWAQTSLQLQPELHQTTKVVS